MSYPKARVLFAVLAISASLSPTAALARASGPKAAPATESPATATPAVNEPTDGSSCGELCECASGHHRAPRVSITLGGSWERYTGENRVTNDAGAALTGAAHFDLDLDFGFYFRPTTDNLMFGLAIDLGADSWSNSPSLARITQIFIGAKASYFFSEIGRGAYLHGDLGPVAFMDQLGNQTGRTTQSTQTGSPMGIGVRLGTGYAFHLGTNVSLLAAFDWSYRTAGASSAMPLTLSGGILF